MMILEELKKFLDSLPERFNGFGIVNGEVGVLPKENETDEDEVVYRCDKPIVTLYVDEKTSEVCFLHQAPEEVTDLAGEDFVDGEKTTTGDKSNGNT